MEDHGQPDHVLEDHYSDLAYAELEAAATGAPALPAPRAAESADDRYDRLYTAALALAPRP